MPLCEAAGGPSCPQSDSKREALASSSGHKSGPSEGSPVRVHFRAREVQQARACTGRQAHGAPAHPAEHPSTGKPALSDTQDWPRGHRAGRGLRRVTSLMSWETSHKEGPPRACSGSPRPNNKSHFTSCWDGFHPGSHNGKGRAPSQMGSQQFFPWSSQHPWSERENWTAFR